MKLTCRALTQTLLDLAIRPLNYIRLIGHRGKRSMCSDGLGFLRLRRWMWSSRYGLLFFNRFINPLLLKYNPGLMPSMKIRLSFAESRSLYPWLRELRKALILNRRAYYHIRLCRAQRRALLVLFGPRFLVQEGIALPDQFYVFELALSYNKPRRRNYFVSEIYDKKPGELDILSNYHLLTKNK